MLFILKYVKPGLSFYNSNRDMTCMQKTLISGVLLLNRNHMLSFPSTLVLYWIFELFYCWPHIKHAAQVKYDLTCIELDSWVKMGVELSRCYIGELFLSSYFLENNENSYLTIAVLFSFVCCLCWIEPLILILWCLCFQVMYIPRRSRTRGHVITCNEISEVYKFDMNWLCLCLINKKKGKKKKKKSGSCRSHSFPFPALSFLKV